MAENLPQNTAVAAPTAASLGQYVYNPSTAASAPVNPQAASAAAPAAQQATTPQPLNLGQYVYTPPAPNTQTAPPTTQSSNGGSQNFGTLPNGQPVDPSVVAVMTAIQNVETGGSSDPYNQSGDNGQSLGAYQWNNLINGVHTPLQPGQIPANFQNAAVQFGLNPNDFSPKNQNLVAYNQIAAYKAQGLTPQSIDAMWNGAQPDPNNPGQYTYVNPARAPLFQNALNQVVQGMSQSQTQNNTPTPTTPASPSLGGFLNNTVSSAGNFVGNLINAAVHPIQTVQGLGEAAAGGFQELGGQNNANTEAFNNIVDYFKQRYGSVNDLLNTAYTDPVGLAADVSAALGVGEGALGAVGMAGKASEAADAARVGADLETAAGNGIDHIVTPSGTAIPTDGSVSAADVVPTPVSDFTNTVGGALGSAARLTNPLTPIVSAVEGGLNEAGGVLSKVGSTVTSFEPSTIDEIVAHPEEFTTQAIANTTRAGVAQQIASALDDKETALEEAGTTVGGFRESNQQIPVAKNFLEDQLRKQAGVDVVDGQVEANTESRIRDPKDVAAVQKLFDMWKPAFQKGSLSTGEFLNFRQDLANVAKYDREFSASKPVEAIASKIRTAFNGTYRDAVPGLKEADEAYSTQSADLQRLRKGFLDKDGNLTPAATNRIANAVGKGKDLDLARLEEISPGITKKLTALKAIEDIQRSGGTKVGSYPSAFLKTGGVVASVATGNMGLLATTLATSFLAQPEIAVPILRAIGANKSLVANITARLAKIATIGAVSSRATGQSNLAQEQALESSTQPGATTPAQQ